LTKKIKSGLHGSLEGHLGRFNNQKYEGIVRKKVDRFGINLSGNWEKTDGFRVNSGEKGYKFGSRLQYFHTLEDVFSLSADYSYLDAENSGPIYRLTPHAHSQDENFGVSLIMLFQKFNSETHISLYDRAYEDPDSHFASRLKNGSLKQRIFWSPFFKYFGTLDFGADFAMEHVSGSNLQSIDERSLGLYCGKKYSYTRFPFKKIPLQATLGLRVNLHSEFSTAVNPSLRLTYNPGAMDISFTVERFNTIPSFRRRYYNTTTFKGNPQLKIEKGTNYSLGISSKPTRSINLSASLFYSHVDDRINYVRQGQIGTYENVGSSTKKGIEASIKWKISKKIQVSCSYTYLDARDDQTNRFLTYSPEHKAIIDLQSNPLPDFFIGTVTKYKSARYYNSDNSGSLSGTYFRTDLTAEYTFGNNYAFFCRIDNLFDHDFHIIDGYPVTPRSLTMGLKYEY
jgi:iron complex outermembrane receptor protein